MKTMDGDALHHGNARAITGDAGNSSVTLTLGIRMNPINRTCNSGLMVHSFAHLVAFSVYFMCNFFE
jgi:hypothetical protein